MKTLYTLKKALSLGKSAISTYSISILISLSLKSISEFSDAASSMPFIVMEGGRGFWRWAQFEFEWEGGGVVVGTYLRLGTD